MMKAIFSALTIVLLTAAAPAYVVAQGMPTAYGPGGYVSLGGGVSDYQFQYGQRKLGGIMMYTDVNPTWRYGVEAEVRSLRYNTNEDVTETTYMAGPRVTILPGPIRPYVKLLAGAGDYSLPFHLAQGSFLTVAPGGGVDVMLTNYIAVRVIDVEYQVTKQFQASPDLPLGQLVNYGISGGISIRLTRMRTTPRIWGYGRREYGR